MQTPAQPLNAISPTLTALLLRKTPPHQQPAVAASRERVVRGGKVLFYPCPDGTVRIVGVTDRGRWVGEWHCLAEDYNENMMLRMARHVMKKAGKLALVG